MSQIRSKALSFLDERELAGNSGFKNPKFEELMKRTGWQKGQAWCAYFVELVWEQSGQNAELFSGSTVKTFENFKKADPFRIHSNPCVGDVVIWQNYRKGKPKWTGHAGIVVAVQGGQIVTVEGNTNSSGGREGIEVALKIRNLDFTNNNGLRILGFIIPIYNRTVNFGTIITPITT